MRRYGRILLNAATALSFVLCVTAVALHIRGALMPAVRRSWVARDGDPTYLFELGSHSLTAQRVTAWRDVSEFGDPPPREVNLAGFRYRRWATLAFSTDGHVVGVVAETSEFWFEYRSVIVWTALLPLLGLLRLGGRRDRDERNRLAGHCPACGYDLRATPDRCPECGTIPTR